MLEKIKLLLGITGTDKDGLLEVLIELTEEEVREYCKIQDLRGLESALIQIIVFKYNRIGTEGLNSESYSGVSYSYSDYPEHIRNILDSHRNRKIEVK